jgi:hypothetical protein
MTAGPVIIASVRETEMHRAFCVVHRYRGAAAGFRVGSEGRHHKLVAHASHGGAG